MTDQFIMYVILPVIGGAIIFNILWFFLSFYKHKEFAGAMSKIASGSKYVFTRGVEKGTTDLFVDLDVAISDYSFLKSVIDWYVLTLDKITKKFGRIDRIAFMEKDSGPVGALLLTAALVEKTKIPAIIVRLRKRLLINSIKGYKVKKAANIVLISDVLTSGGGIKEAVNKLTSQGVCVRAAVFLVSRASSEYIKNIEKELEIPMFYGLEAQNKEDLQQWLTKGILNKLKRGNGSPFSMSNSISV